MSDTQPLAYLVTASTIALESYELSRLNRASNLRKEVLELLDRWVEAEIEARMAREVLDSRRCETGGSTYVVSANEKFLGSAADAAGVELKLRDSRSRNIGGTVNFQRKKANSGLFGGKRTENSRAVPTRRVVLSSRAVIASPANFSSCASRTSRGAFFGPTVFVHKRLLFVS